MSKPEIARNGTTRSDPAAVEHVAVGTHLRLAAISILGQLRDDAGIVLVIGQPSAQLALATYLIELLEQETAGEIVRVVSRPNSTPEDVLRQCCADLGVAADGDAAAMRSVLAEQLATNRRKGADTILWLGNADAPTTQHLRDIYRCFQTEDALRLPVILAAGPDFDARLDAPELRDVKQALRARYRLPSLDSTNLVRSEETAPPRASDTRVHKAVSASEASAVLLNILSEAGSKAKSEGLLRYPEPRQAEFRTQAPANGTEEGSPGQGAAPLLLLNAEAPPPARREWRLGAFALAGVGYVGIVAVIGSIVLQTLPLGPSRGDRAAVEPRILLRDSAAAPLPPAPEPEKIRPAVAVPPATAEGVGEPDPSRQSTPGPDSEPMPTAVALVAPASEPLPAEQEAIETTPLSEPPAPSVAAEDAAPSRAPSMPQAEIDLLMRRGQQFLEMGDVVAARLFFEPLAAGGHPSAAMSLGKTHDPLYLAKVGARGVRPDPARAAAWYRKASGGGDAEATDRLRQLLARFPQ